MRMGVGLSQEQSQKLMMTPELRMAISILQYSALELAEFIDQELTENPVLEARDETAEPDSDDSVMDKAESAESEKFDIEWQEYFADGSDLGYQQEGRYTDREEIRFENFLAAAPTLTDHLVMQLNLTGISPGEKAVGEFLIGNTDANGYLEGSLTEAAAACGVEEATVEKVLAVIHSFDPPGVGARNLKECLLIQCKHLNLAHTILPEVISSHLNDLALGKLNKIAETLGVPVQEVQRAADRLRTLDPKPGRYFSHADDTRYIVPDVVIERVNGEYVVLVNDTTAPRLGVSPVYRDILAGKFSDPDTAKYIEQKLNSALWLIKSIEQRRLTLYKVTQTLVEMQRDFLDRGVKYLKPLNLKHVATALGFHESTISRATAGKYIQTPQGVFEMKYFFAGGVETVNGTMASAETIKRTVKEMIGAEDHTKPLSDQKIADILNCQGIEISRRTVAKYRDEMGIPATGRRKRY
ncbi:RNA polymerase factor sigma-54 [bacterium]|nr:MAG: RNA polymerase factor sigma-54 [bacterium]